MKPGQVSEAFAVVAQLAGALGVERIDKLPGCWEHQIDEHWHVAVNGHIEGPQKVRDVDVLLDPFHAYVRFNGWPAGMFTPFDGEFVVGADCNESDFIAAVRKAITNAKAEKPADSAHVQAGLDLKANSR